MPTQELAIRCPATGLPVPTGEKTEGRAIPRSMERKMLAGCSACGGSHSWLLREAWLIPAADDEPLPDLDAELL
jgi:hypothetical protein